MVRPLVLAVVIGLTFSSVDFASAHDGSHSPSGGRGGCCGRTIGRAPANRFPAPSRGCAGGGCQSHARQPGPAIQWYASPAGPTRRNQIRPNQPQTFEPAPRFVPQQAQPFLPPSGFGPTATPPPIPPQANGTPLIPQEMEGIAQLPLAEQRAALRQRTCPVTKDPLGSMGKPIRVSVAGQSLFVCCEGCVDALKENPRKYLTAATATPTLLR